MTRTENLNRYLDPAKHIIQIWSQTTDKHMATIAESGFKMIFTNYNIMYLDCGFGNWLIEVILLGHFSIPQNSKQSLKIFFSTFSSIVLKQKKCFNHIITLHYVLGE